ncbi:Asp23/Gls24 family envelope stress response protein [Hoyosella subflava]|uniref:Hypothetical membrane protein n=1 Tax=Hoyosella subflava (strain DSM 45089 / JCM 17490 / NBRC 109087 / DQS3-9A1) TaxID=443218 RepID=F6EHX4_HOYSD|nr:hypothetical protein [Hoyosella subflava]AEF38922.1 Hypothetical membrane protein [Hoyosella subflava DQS3-9A1]
MTALIVALNRVVSVMVGTILALGALVVLGYQAGWGWARTAAGHINPETLLELTDERWWPRAVFGISILAIALGGLVVGLALWPDRIGPVVLDPDSADGHLTVDLRALAGAVAHDLKGRIPAATDVRAHPFLDRGVPTISLTITLPGNADLGQAGGAVADSIADIYLALEGAPIAIPVFFEVTRNRPVPIKH